MIQKRGTSMTWMCIYFVGHFLQRQMPPIFGSWGRTRLSEPKSQIGNDFSGCRALGQVNTGVEAP